MKMAAVLLGGPHCTTGIYRSGLHPNLEVAEVLSTASFYHILLARTQATTKEAGKFPLYSGETD